MSSPRRRGRAFVSRRQAIRAAIELQERLYEETVADPELLLLAGIGLDAGEAVPVEAMSWRGLQLAARLCGQAKAGRDPRSRGRTWRGGSKGCGYDQQGDLRLEALVEPVTVVRGPRRSTTGRPTSPPTLRPPHARNCAHGRGRRGALVAGGLALLLIAVGSRDPWGLGRRPDHGARRLGDVDGCVGCHPRVDPYWARARARSPLVRAPSGSRAPTRAGSAGGSGLGGGDRHDPCRRGPDGDRRRRGFRVGRERRWARAFPASACRRTMSSMRSPGAGPNAIAVGLDAVWVTCGFDTVAMRIDAPRGHRRRSASLEVQAESQWGAEAVWMSTAPPRAR